MREFEAVAGDWGALGSERNNYASRNACYVWEPSGVAAAGAAPVGQAAGPLGRVGASRGWELRELLTRPGDLKAKPDRGHRLSLQETVAKA